MDTTNIITIILSILSSSIVTLILSIIIFEPIREKKKYIFDEKKRVYESIIIFAQIVLYPKEAKYALGVARYNIQELTDDENIRNALNDIKMAVPKLRLITKNEKVLECTNRFIHERNEVSFEDLIVILQKDLYSYNK